MIAVLVSRPAWRRGRHSAVVRRPKGTSRVRSLCAGVVTANVQLDGLYEFNESRVRGPHAGRCHYAWPDPVRPPDALRREYEALTLALSRGFAGSGTSFTRNCREYEAHRAGQLSQRLTARWSCTERASRLCAERWLPTQLASGVASAALRVRRRSHTAQRTSDPTRPSSRDPLPHRPARPPQPASPGERSQGCLRSEGPSYGETTIPCAS